MAADLEIRIPLTVKIHSDHRRATTDTPPLDDESSKTSEEQEEEEDCHTPTSPHHMIPAALICPPAPKKPRLAAPACKRKLFDLSFFEKEARDEVEALFRSTVHQVNLNGSIKRKCI